MTEQKQKMLVLLGSFRRGAYTQSIADYVVSVFSDTYELEFPSLIELPLFCQGYDDEGIAPEEWKAFRAQVAACDAVLFITPEHNRSYPAVLKNALDIASRPAGQSVWTGKPAAIISHSPGRIGGALGNQHLRQPLSFLNLRLMAQPEMYVSDVSTLLNEEGTLSDEPTQRHLRGFVAAFEMWIAAG